MSKILLNFVTMTKSETYIQFIIGELRSGNVEFVKVCTVFCSKFQKTERTFASYWKKANETYKNELDAIKMAQMDLHTQNELNAVKTQINRKEYKQAVLKKIIDGEFEFEKVVFINGKETRIKCKPEPSDVLKAIDIDNKIEGDYAPTKQNVQIEEMPAPIINHVGNKPE